MTSEEFNKKYIDYLEKGHYGLDINIPELTMWLDNKFQEFIKKPNFKYYQIKSKFNMGRFYCDGLTRVEEKEVEDKITNLLSKND